MLKVQLLSESLSKPLKRFKQETDPIRLCFRKKLNALENFLQRDVGMETTRPVSRSRVAYKSWETWIPVVAHPLIHLRGSFLCIWFLLPLHCLSFLPPSLSIITKSEIATISRFSVSPAFHSPAHTSVFSHSSNKPSLITSAYERFSLILSLKVIGWCFIYKDLKVASGQECMPVVENCTGQCLGAKLLSKLLFAGNSFPVGQTFWKCKLLKRGFSKNKCLLFCAIFFS